MEKREMYSNQKNEGIDWVSVAYSLLPPIIVGLVLGVAIMYGVGIFDSEEQKTIKEMQKVQDEIKEKEAQKFNAEVRYNIENGKLSCEYISKIIIGDAKGDNDLLSFSYFNDNLRAYWNANNCGYEWNWWD
jgi:F0F1-type ATP synthase assembly protein I